MGTSNTHGRLYLVPAPLDFGCASQAPLEQVIPQGTLQVAARLQHWVCENAKTTRAYLKRVDALVPLSCALQALHIQELPREVHKKGDHLPGGNPGKGSATSTTGKGSAGVTAGFDAKSLLQAALSAHGGHDIGLVSEAGMPAIADPGSSVVRAAHDLGLQVVPLVGPVSLLLALAASGLNGQNFAFVGYLPQDSVARVARIRELEALALQTGQAQLFIETPYRNAALMQALTQTLNANTRLSVSAGLTLESGQTCSHNAKAWKHQPMALDNSTPAVFGIGR